MKTEQLNWSADTGWNVTRAMDPATEITLVLAFGAVDEVSHPERFAELRERYPDAQIVMSSTAGEISANAVKDDTISATAIAYEKTRIKPIVIEVSDHADSYECGKALAAGLIEDDLAHVLVISDGGMVNGDALVKGLNESLKEKVIITGGLAADAGRFKETYVGLNAAPRSGVIVGIGHYGSDLKVSHGSNGGWDEFGPIRRVTRSLGNVLYELDGQTALDLYKKYLGSKSEDLPGSALLYPVSLYTASGEQVVRTILSIDEEEGSMTFAGDIPQGAEIRLMMANFDRLIDGAGDAAEASWHAEDDHEADLVLMISSVGRKLVLNDRVGEEVDSVIEIFGESAAYAGFYSNGEISPGRSFSSCSLHNQTMTITTYSEQ